MNRQGKISSFRQKPSQRHTSKGAKISVGRRTRMQVAKLVLSYLLVGALLALGWLYQSLPSRLYVEQGGTVQLARFPFVSPLRQYGTQSVISTQISGNYNTTFALGGVLPVKTVRTVVTERPKVRVSGMPFGVKMFSDGAMIVGFSDILLSQGGTVNPAKEAGLRLGDRIISLNGTSTPSNEAVRDALAGTGGIEADVVYVRNGKQFTTHLRPIWDDGLAQWRAGMWVRDSSAGVGTMTFFDPGTGIFAGLGHSINDTDTGESVALRSGEIVPCEIIGYNRGIMGSPGELKGRFLGTLAIGTIRLNDENGVYGSVREELEGEELEVAFAQEVTTGEAELWTTISGNQPRRYQVRIERINDSDPVRNLVIRVTDPSLLDETGGIVQGMSGSPLVQNGRLIGAVTHVLVNDPTRGYGIFAETMLEHTKAVSLP